MSKTLEQLKELADELKISYRDNIGVEALQKKIDAVNSKASKPVKEKKELTQAEKNAKLAKECKKLIRCRITNMNPDKQNIPGEIYTVSNRIVGTLKKFIPYSGAEDGYHVPQMILDILKEKQYQSHYVVKSPTGEKINKTRMVKEFAIEILPALTEEELKELARKQIIAEGGEG